MGRPAGRSTWEGLPVIGPADAPGLDPVEKHRQLRGVDLDRHRVAADVRQLELAALEALLEEEEPARVPGENLHPVRPAGS